MKANLSFTSHTASPSIYNWIPLCGISTYCNKIVTCHQHSSTHSLTDLKTWFNCKLVFSNCMSIFPKYIRVAIDRWSEMGPGRLVTDILWWILLHWHIWRMSHGKCPHRLEGLTEQDRSPSRECQWRMTENRNNLQEVIWRLGMEPWEFIPFDLRLSSQVLAANAAQIRRQRFMYRDHHCSIEYAMGKHWKSPKVPECKAV